MTIQCPHSLRNRGINQLTSAALAEQAATLETKSRFWSWIMLLVFVGCATKYPSGIESPEMTFEEQVASVKSGISFEVRSAQSITDAEFEQLRGLDRLQVLLLTNARLTDGIAPTLASLVSLRQLRLEIAPIADESAEAIGKLASLTSINLPRSNISNLGIADWPELTELILLRIGSPILRDEAMATIAKIRQLRFLHLIDVPISDAGIKHLHGMSQLESFYLDGGLASNQGLTELLQALPELHFHRDQQHLLGDPQADDHGKR